MDDSETLLAHYGGQTSLLPPDENEKWTGTDIEEARSKLLKISLKQLFDGRESPASRAEALRWLLDDQDAPFSAARCCEAAGRERGLQTNIQDLRETVLYKLERQQSAPDVLTTTRKRTRDRVSPQEELLADEVMCA